MARDTVRKMAEAKADELGITSKDQRDGSSQGSFTECGTGWKKPSSASSGDLFTQEKPGTRNGKFLGYLANGETRDELLARYKRGELPGLNLEYAKQWLGVK